MASPQSLNVSSHKSYEDFIPIFHFHHVRYVRIQWVDFSSQVRCRVLTMTHFRKLLESDRPGITLTKGTFGLVAIQRAPSFSAVGEHIYVIDYSSFRPCSYAPGHAVFFGYVQEQVPIPRPTGLSFEVPFCPRTTLSRLIQYAAKELGIEFLVGVETEFILLKSVNPLVFVNEYQCSTAAALTTGTTEAQVLEEIADAIQADGIEVQMYHAEDAPGQYEIVTGPMSPLAAADALVHTRQTIYNISNKHGLRATLAPRPTLDSCGSGAHIHISVHGKRPSTTASELLTPVESAFLAGLMDHLPSVIALMLPLSASYTRMVDGIWAGGTWACWGVDNREVAVRLTRPYSPTSRNFEIRTVDGTSNPYLAIMGVLACGILGIRDKRALVAKSCDTARTPTEMTVEERNAMGITKRLPLNIGDARQYLAADDAIKDVLGPELVEAFIEVNKLLGKFIDRRQGEEDSRALARLIENY